MANNKYFADGVDAPVVLPVAIKECRICGGKFVPTSHNQTTCPECRRRKMDGVRETSPRGHAGQPHKIEPALTTSLEWYRVTDKRPEKSQEVLFISDTGASIGNCTYSKRYNKFNASDYEGGDEHAYDVAYWAYIPENLQREMDAVWDEWIKARYAEGNKKED